MAEFCAGGLARSLAGHDKGELYVVIRREGKRIWLSDGRHHPLDGQKQKNPRHLEVIGKYEEAFGGRLAQGLVRDEEIRRVIRAAKQQEGM